MSAPEAAWTHTTVLLNEAVQALVTRDDGVYVDGTFGRGGHTRALLARLWLRIWLSSASSTPCAARLQYIKRTSMKELR